MLFYLFLFLLGFFFILLVYISIMTLIYSEKKAEETQNFPGGISIVIPFYNEAPRLKALLESLVNQDYQGPYEIILVNDRSTDDFSKYIDPFLQASAHPIKLITSTFNKSLRLTSKQQAMDIGVSNAIFSSIVFTDADMLFERKWLGSLAKTKSAGYDLVFGHTIIRKSGKNFLTLLQAYQLEFLFAVAFAFHASRLPGSCMGNNLFLSKKAYLDVGGQAGIGFSIVEDRALFLKFKSLGLKVAPAYPFTALAQTYPCMDFRGFFRQIFRWARGGFFEKCDLLPIGFLFFFQHVFLFFALFGGIHGTLAAIAFANFGITLVFILCAFKKMNSKENALLLPFYYAVLLIEIIVFLGSFASSSAISWKNRKL
jgi:cellulose synthase/poly-beta-1,6-N-acetylglucosamine synthase-like glycosyltransferase